MRKAMVLFVTICLALIAGWVLQPSTATGAHATRHQKMPHQTIYVPARSAGENGRFLQTGFVLKKGLSVTIKATGTAYTTICSPACGTDPNGNASIICPIICAGPGLFAFSLIGKVGRGHLVFIGTGPRTVSGRGRLALAYNDGNYTDNSGGYTVRLTYRCALGNVACATVRISRPVAGKAFTPTPTNTPTSTPTATPTATPTSTPTATATSTPTPTATFTATPTVTPSPVPMPTATSTSTPFDTPTPVDTVTIAPNPIPVNTPAPVYVQPTYCIPKEGDDDNDDKGKPPGGNDHDGCP